METDVITCLLPSRIFDPRAFRLHEMHNNLIASLIAFSLHSSFSRAKRIGLEIRRACSLMLMKIIETAILSSFRSLHGEIYSCMT